MCLFDIGFFKLFASDTLTKAQMFDLSACEQPVSPVGWTWGWSHRSPWHRRQCPQQVLSPISKLCACFGLFCFLRLFFGSLYVIQDDALFSSPPAKFWAHLLNGKGCRVDKGESSVNGCTARTRQEKADGCSVNGASPLDLTGRETFSLSAFLKAH